MSSAGFHRNNRRRSFKVFYNKKRPEIARKYPFLGAKQIQRKVEELWRRLDPKEKDGFCVVSPAVEGIHFRLRRQPAEEDNSQSPSFHRDRTLERQTKTYSRYQTPSTTAADVEVPSLSDEEEGQHHEVDKHHSVKDMEPGFVRKTGRQASGKTLTSNTLWKKKLCSHTSLSSEAESDDNYIPRTTGNRSQSTMRSRGLLTLHMARMQMVATTSEGIGRGELTRTSNSESEGISCSEDWFDQDVVTKQQSYLDEEETETSKFLSENQSEVPMQEIGTTSTNEVDSEDRCLKENVTEEEGTVNEVTKVETTEDVGEHILSPESKQAIIQYLSGSGFNGTFDTTSSEDERQGGETMTLIESAIVSLESDILNDNRNTGTVEQRHGKDFINYSASAVDRVGSILAHIINEVVGNADPNTATFGKTVNHGKENVKGCKYDSGDDGSKTAQPMKGIFQTTSDRDSRSELWDRMFRRETHLKSTRRYTRKQSSSFSESGESWDVETALETGLASHLEVQEKTYQETTGACSSDDVSVYRPHQNVTQDTSAPSTEDRGCYDALNNANVENNSESRTKGSPQVGTVEQIDKCKVIPSSEVNVEEDVVLTGTVDAHQTVLSTPSYMEQPSISILDKQPAIPNGHHELTHGGEHSTGQLSGSTSMDSLKEMTKSHLTSASLDTPSESEEQMETKSGKDRAGSTKPRGTRRGTPRPAQNTMVRLLTRDYKISTRAQSAAEKRNTRSRVLDYRRLSGQKGKEKTPNRKNWQRTDSRDSILSTDSRQSVRTPRQKGKKRKRHQSTSSVGSDFSTTSSVSESHDYHLWEDLPTDDNEATNDTNTDGIYNSETNDSVELEYFSNQLDESTTNSEYVPPVAVKYKSAPSADMDEQIDERVSKKSQETRTPEPKDTDDPNRGHGRQEDGHFERQVGEEEHSGQEESLKPQEDYSNQEAVPSSSGGFLCELFSDPKPHTGTWLPGFNRSVSSHHEAATDFIDFEDDRIFL